MFRASVQENSDKRGERKRKICFSGSYDFGTKIILVTYLPPHGALSVSFTAERLQLFRFRLSQTIQHELVHHHQTIIAPSFVPYKKNLRKIPPAKKRRFLGWMKYLSDESEIAAWAHDIAMEIQFFYPNVLVDEVLGAPHKYKKITSYRIYEKYFKAADWNEIRTKLHDTIRSWSERPPAIPAR